MWVAQAIAMRAGGDEWLVETGHRDPMFVRLSDRTAYPVHRVRALTAMPGWVPPDADWLPEEAQAVQLATHRVRPELRR